MGMWDSLRDRLTVYSEEEALPKPSEADLDRYEAATGFKLPESYREFVLTFGAGELAWTFTIAAPGYSTEIELERYTRSFRRTFHNRSDADLARSHDAPPRARRLVLFANDIGPDYYGFDPEDVRDAAAHEYGIYSLMHSDPRVLSIAGSFREFIEGYCLGGGWASEVGHEMEEDTQLEMVFFPVRS